MQELEETGYWLELLAESGVVSAERLNDLQHEIEEIKAIFITIVKKVKQNMKGET